MWRLAHFHFAHGRATAWRTWACASHRHAHCPGARCRVIHGRYHQGSALGRWRLARAVLHGLPGGRAFWGPHGRMGSRVTACCPRMLPLCARMPGRGFLGLGRRLFHPWMRGTGHAGHVHWHRLRKNRARGSDERGGKETIEQHRSPLHAPKAVSGPPHGHANHEQVFRKRDEA
jgi:hypothetical protein